MQTWAMFLRCVQKDWKEINTVPTVVTVLHWDCRWFLSCILILFSFFTILRTCTQVDDVDRGQGSVCVSALWARRGSWAWRNHLLPCGDGGSVLRGSRTADAPVAMPPGRDGHFKAPDTIPLFKDTEVLQFHGWQGSSSPKEDLGWG